MGIGVIGNGACRSLVVCLGVAAGGVLSGCGGPQLQVLRQEVPNPFANKTEYSLEPIAFVDLVVDGQPESAYIASLEPDSLRSWQEDKKAVSEIFLEELRSQANELGIQVYLSASSAPFAIQPVVRKIETGYYRIPAWNAVTVIEMNLQITGASGAVLDEIFLKDSAAFDALFAASTGGRLRSISKVLATEAVEYLQSRVHPE